ncbi:MULTISPECIES: hypothetical protein [unclassified Brevibacterium]|uniref:hypothetical protein n=1 Tax=unclassified Brevibacterium TaxID=2614124 RepID=UPI001E4CC227|nr:MULTISPECIES: hypothetical protein [unclassified Brevibacterium]MCD1287319.1 hypothetical protein [Brevibacterium sp. CCUG 69071]MDK8436426.1 hypothetical protein [Brevibacterium sp. H-BE7]
MSDREEMRDRIRDTIRSGASESGVVMASEEAAAMAQAIIDDLGLTVEVADNCNDCGNGPEERVVGKWEKQ